MPGYALRLTPGLLREMLGTTAPVMLEIGANNGTDTWWLCQTFPACRMYYLEPDPRPATRFRDKLAGRSNVQLFTVALADSYGEVSFYPSTGTRSARSAHRMPGGWDMSGSIREPTGHLAQHPWVQFKDPVTVQAQRLDDWAAGHGVDSVDFVWMDTQCAEGDIIAGGRRVFANTRSCSPSTANERCTRVRRCFPTCCACWRTTSCSLATPTMSCSATRVSRWRRESGSSA